MQTTGSVRKLQHSRMPRVVQAANLATDTGNVVQKCAEACVPSTNSPVILDRRLAHTKGPTHSITTSIGCILRLPGTRVTLLRNVRGTTIIHALRSTVNVISVPQGVGGDRVREGCAGGAARGKAIKSFYQFQNIRTEMGNKVQRRRGRGSAQGKCRGPQETLAPKNKEQKKMKNKR